MRWLLLLLVAVGCDPMLEEEDIGEDLDGIDCEHATFDGRFIDEVEQPEVAARATEPGVVVVERIETQDDGVVPIERGDVDTSPLPHCRPLPTCLETLLRDKPVSGARQAVLFFDGLRVSAGHATGQPTGLSIVDLPRNRVIEPASGEGFEFSFDDRSVTICVGVANCQVLDLVDDTARTVTSFPRATSPGPAVETASRSP